MEWLSGLFALFGVLLGLGFSEYRSWREGKVRFRIMTFEKRLQAHQEALSCWYELHHVLNKIETIGEEKCITIDKLENWWENNLLFLDEVSRDKMLVLIGEAREHGTNLAESHTAVFRTLKETRAALIRGIGAKHLPEMPEPNKEKT